MVKTNNDLNLFGWKNAFKYFNNWYPVFWDHVENSISKDSYNNIFPTTTRKLSLGEKGYTRAGNYNAQFGMNIAYKDPEMDHPSIDTYMCRVETRTKDGGKTLVIDNKKIGLLPAGVHKNVFMLLGYKGYYSVFDHSWLNDNKYFVTHKETIPAHEKMDKNGHIRHYKERIKNNREYNLEALLRDRKIWQCVFDNDKETFISISGDVFHDDYTKIIHERSLFFNLSHANDSLYSMATSISGLTIPYDPIPSSEMFFAVNNETITSHEMTVADFCSKIELKGSKEYKVLVNKVHRRLETFITTGESKPLVASNGKTYYIANHIVDLDKTNKEAARVYEEKRKTSEEQHKMRTKIRTWLKRHDWQINPKWDREEQYEARMMISNHKNNI